MKKKNIAMLILSIILVFAYAFTVYANEEASGNKTIDREKVSAVIVTKDEPDSYLFKTLINESICAYAVQSDVNAYSLYFVHQNNSVDFSGSEFSSFFADLDNCNLVIFEEGDYTFSKDSFNFANLGSNSKYAATVDMTDASITVNGDGDIYAFKGANINGFSLPASLSLSGKVYLDGTYIGYNESLEEVAKCSELVSSNNKYGVVYIAKSLPDENDIELLANTTPIWTDDSGNKYYSENAKATYDLSKNQDKGILAYLFDTDSDGTGDTYVITSTSSTNLLRNGGWWSGMWPWNPWNLSDNPWGVTEDIKKNTKLIVFRDKVVGNEDFSHFFQDLSNLKEVRGLENIDCTNATNMYSMFGSCSNLQSVDLSSWKSSKVTTVHDMFASCGNLKTVKIGTGFDTSNVTDFTSMFYRCYNLESVDLENIKTDSATVLACMFDNNQKLATMNIANWNVSKCTNFGGMFNGCSKVTILDVSKWNTSAATNMDHMFYACSSVKSYDFSKWNTAKCTNMAEMFNRNSSVTLLDLSSFDTSKVENMVYMFRECGNLKEIKGQINTSSCTNLNHMFSWSTSLTTVDLSKFNTTKCTDFSYMFERVPAETIDISSFTISESANTEGMFLDASNVKMIDLKGFQSIGKRAFENCNALSRLRNMDNVKSIASGAFYRNGSEFYTNVYECSNSVVKNYNWISDGRTIVEKTYDLNKDKTLKGKIDDTGKLIITGTGTTLDIGLSSVLPSGTELTGIDFSGAPNLTTIGSNWCYNQTNLGSFVIPNTVTTIENYAFFYSGGASLTLPDKIKTIGSNAFSNWKSTGSNSGLTIPDSATSIGESAFSGSTWTGPLTIGKGLTEIPKRAFYKVEGFTGDLNIPGNITSIGEDAFGYAGEKSWVGNKLILNEGLVCLQKNAFYCCSGFRGDLVIPNTVENIGEMAFANNRNKADMFNGRIVIGSSVKTIGLKAFYQLALIGNLTIPDSVVSIGEYAFGSCSSLSGTLSLGSSLQTIDKYAFSYCEKLTTIKGGDSLTTIGIRAFETNAYDTVTFYHNVVTDLQTTNTALKIHSWIEDNRSITYILSTDKKLTGTVDYNKVLYVKGDGTTLDIPLSAIIVENVFFTKIDFTEAPNLTTIGDTWCTAQTRLGELVIPDTVTTIGENAFYKSGGKSLTLSNNLISIGNEAFRSWKSKSGGLTVPDSVTKMGDYAFAESTFAGGLTLGTGLTNLPQYAFYKSSGFTGDLVIPSNIKELGREAISRCENSWVGGSLKLTEGLVTIGDYAFANDTGLRGNVVIPNTVTKIGSYALSNDTKDSEMFKGGSLVLGTAVKEIGEYAFHYQGSLTGNLTIPDSVTSVGINAFSDSGFTGTLLLGNGLTTIKANAFAFLPNITTIKGGNKITLVEAGAFKVTDAVETTLLSDNDIMYNYDWDINNRTIINKKGDFIFASFFYFDAIAGQDLQELESSYDMVTSGFFTLKRRDGGDFVTDAIEIKGNGTSSTSNSITFGIENENGYYLNMDYMVKNLPDGEYIYKQETPLVGRFDFKPVVKEVTFKTKYGKIVEISENGVDTLKSMKNLPDNIKTTLSQTDFSSAVTLLYRFLMQMNSIKFESVDESGNNVSGVQYFIYGEDVNGNPIDFKEGTYKEFFYDETNGYSYDDFVDGGTGCKYVAIDGHNGITFTTTDKDMTFYVLVEGTYHIVQLNTIENLTKNDPVDFTITAYDTGNNLSGKGFVIGNNIEQTENGYVLKMVNKAVTTTFVIKVPVDIGMNLSLTGERGIPQYKGSGTVEIESYTIPNKNITIVPDTEITMANKDKTKSMIATVTVPSGITSFNNDTKGATENTNPDNAIFGNISKTYKNSMPFTIVAPANRVSEYYEGKLGFTISVN